MRQFERKAYNFLEAVIGKFMNEILEILSKNAKASPSEIAALLGKAEEEVTKEIKELEESGVITRYITLINWEKLEESPVFAMLDLKVALQRKTGYDSVAERIARFSEVESVRLISGDHDLSVIIRGKSMKDLAYFVAEKIAPLEGIQSTCTHFILRSYKEHGVIPMERSKPKRLVITP